MTTPNRQPSPSESSDGRPPWPPGLDVVYRDPYVPSDPKATVAPLMEKFKKDLDRIFGEHETREAGSD